VSILAAASLRENRVAFSQYRAILVLWISEQEYQGKNVEVALDEVTVHSPRRALHNGQKIAVADAVHKHGSFHHQGLAADLLLYVNGKYITDGGHPLWTIIGQKWESLNPLCTSGIRWQDANHVSYGGEGSRSKMAGMVA